MVLAVRRGVRHELDEAPHRRPVVIGAVARTIEEWREHIVAGHGISLCPASAETHNARPGIVFVPGKDTPSTALCVAWRADDNRPAVRSFVEFVTNAAANS